MVTISQAKKFTLHIPELSIAEGEIAVILGPVASGKSTLLSALLGDVYCEGHVAVETKMAFCSQDAWLQSATVRDNILFGSEMNKERYQEVFWMNYTYIELDLVSPKH